MSYELVTVLGDQIGQMALWKNDGVLFVEGEKTTFYSPTNTEYAVMEEGLSFSQRIVTW